MSSRNLAWNSPPAADARLRTFLADITLRASTGVLLGLFAYAAIQQWLASPERVTLLLLVIAGCLTTGLSLFARTPQQRDWRALALVCSLGGTYSFVAYDLTPGMRARAPETLGALLQVLGILWQIYAKASLRRSFGILPANRGIVSRGAYRFVRHPMYLGYLIADTGFLLTNFGVRNLIVYGVQISFQVGRIVLEERLLSGGDGYRAYQNAVRYRMVPKVF